MSVSRRMALKLGAALGVAAPSLTDVAAKMANTQSLGMVGATFASSDVVSGASQKRMPAKHLLDRLDRANARACRRAMFRFGNLEPDVAAMHSLSLVAKVRLQMRRDDEQETILDALRKLVWSE